MRGARPRQKFWHRLGELPGCRTSNLRLVTAGVRGRMLRHHISSVYSPVFAEQCRMDQKIGLVAPQQTDLAGDELAAVEKLQKAYHDMRAELGKVIVGQEQVIE